MHTYKQGFTLVELSIVLVILGLLVGGVLTGQSLIHAAEIRSVSTQFARFHAATMTFRDKYMGLPGDLTNAQSYWGIADASPATCKTTASTDTKTCNGNGDGNVDPWSGSNETFRYWQHLANAGLVEGNYDGISHGAVDWVATSQNSPVGRISGSFWMVMSVGTVGGNATYFDGVYNNGYQFGGGTGSSDNWNPILKNEDLYNIDMKSDDGKPATGRIVVRGPSGLDRCTNTAANTDMTATYLLTSTTPGCATIFRTLF